MSKPSMIATIRLNSTGETRRFEDERDPKYDDVVEFMWSEGNYACDCNRAAFFAEAAGEIDPHQDCGHAAFSVLSVEDESGRTLYDGDDV